MLFLASWLVKLWNPNARKHSWLNQITQNIPKYPKSYQNYQLYLYIYKSNHPKYTIIYPNPIKIHLNPNALPICVGSPGSTMCWPLLAQVTRKLLPALSAAHGHPAPGRPCTVSRGAWNGNLGASGRMRSEGGSTVSRHFLAKIGDGAGQLKMMICEKVVRQWFVQSWEGIIVSKTARFQNMKG
jgi:hypothetical protein